VRRDSRRDIKASAANVDHGIVLLPKTSSELEAVGNFRFDLTVSGALCEPTNAPAHGG
jgi:hypothetical protein